MKLLPTNLTNIVPLEQFHHKPMVMYDGGLHRFVKELLQWHKLCKLGGDNLHRLPVVALNQNKMQHCQDVKADCLDVLIIFSMGILTCSD